MKIFEFLKEANGQLSSSRLFAFLCVFSAIVDWQHAVWTVGIWHPDYATIGLIIGAIAGKVAQKFGEQPGNAVPVVGTTTEDKS
jgi:hypothetical protein